MMHSNMYDIFNRGFYRQLDIYYYVFIMIIWPTNSNQRQATGVHVQIFRRRPTASKRRRMENNREQTEPRQLEDLPVQPQFENVKPLEQREQNLVQDEGEGDDNNNEQREDNDVNEKQNNIIYPPLFSDFKNHVAARISLGVDRGVLKCHNHINKLVEWSFKETNSNRWIWSNFRDSGLLRLKDVLYKHVNKSLITAFVERWHPETNSFHIIERTLIEKVPVSCGISIV